jgi:hypothetical protein
MSSYDPLGEAEETRDTSTSPGVKGKEVVEQREFSDVLMQLDKVDYLIIGMLVGVPAGLLTTILVLQFIPGYEATAERVVRQVGNVFEVN